MGAIRSCAILVFLSVFPGSESVSGQHVPCYQCEKFKESHPRTDPYQQVRSHCSYPCDCDDGEPTCPPDVSIIRDGCGCCPICAGQLGQPCDGTSVCDEHKGLVCRYPYSGAAVGICQATTGLPCMVSNKTYSHGETFQTDCRTQCSCQNGTYACSSLCPNENISPRGACTHPRLVEVPDQCCREWMCDSTEAEQPPVCKQEFTSWSTCSADCGLGISRRVSNLNQNCVLRNETRICQLRPCEAGMLSLEQRARHRHIRKGHECKATQRVRGPVRLRFGPCRSKKRYRPKFCGSCQDKLGDGCCTPQLSTTIKVEFICSSIEAHGEQDILLQLMEPGRDLWWPDDLLAIGKPEGKLRAWPEAPGNGIPMDRKAAPFPNAKNYDPKILSVVSDEDMHMLQGRGHLGGGDVLVYKPGYNVNNPGPAATEVRTTQGEKSETTSSASTTVGSTTQVVVSESSTPKPKKRKKKKPRKAFTSWLEFRDEEYQMDEYEDEDEARSSRKKRSPENAAPRRRSSRGKDGEGKRYSGSFRQGYLEELESKDDEYEDENDDDDDDSDDSDEGDEDEDDDDGDSDDEDDEDYEDEPPPKRNRGLKKPVFYAFYRRRRDTAALHPRKKGSHPKKHLEPFAEKRSPRLPKTPEETRTRKHRVPKADSRMRYRKEGKIDRMARISRERESEKRKSALPVRKAVDEKEAEGSFAKDFLNRIPESRTEPSSDTRNLLKTGRVVTGKESGRQLSRSKSPYHVAGKARKNRSRRHAPRPPWSGGEEFGQVEGGDHIVSFSVQWIVKCRCGRECDVDVTTVPSELNNLGEVILKRVHRTAPP